MAIIVDGGATTKQVTPDVVQTKLNTTLPAKATAVTPVKSVTAPAIKAPITATPVKSTATTQPLQPTYGANLTNASAQGLSDTQTSAQQKIANLGAEWNKAKAGGANQQYLDALHRQAETLGTSNGGTYDSKTGKWTFATAPSTNVAGGGIVAGGDIGGGGTITGGGGNGGLSTITDGLTKSGQSTIDAGTANINATRDKQIADLQKNYNDAVMNGQMSVNQANADFATQKAQLEQQGYTQNEQANLSGDARGIQNSNEYQAMQNDNAYRQQSLVNTNMTTRDKSIADIKSKLDNLQSNNGIDTANANAQAGYQVAQLTGNTNASVEGKVADLQGQNYFANQQQGFTQANLATQHGYNIQDAQTAQHYAQDNMAQQQQYNVTNAKTNNAYDIQKIGIQFKDDLQKMAKQQGYDMSKISAQGNKQIEQLKVELAVKANQANDDYHTALAREASKYGLTPADMASGKGTPESQVRLAQLKAQLDSNMQDLYAKTAEEAKMKAISTDPNLIINSKTGVITPPLPTAPQPQQEAYKRYKEMINGQGMSDYNPVAPSNSSTTPANTGGAGSNWINGGYSNALKSSLLGVGGALFPNVTPLLSSGDNIVRALGK